MKQFGKFLKMLMLLQSLLIVLITNAQSVNISQHSYHSAGIVQGSVGDYTITGVIGQPFGEVLSKNGFIINEGILQPEAPRVTNFSPVTGSTFGSVTIKGLNFLGATKVTFGDTSALSFTVINDSTITAIIGNGAKGSVGVFTPGGTHYLAGFTYTNTPVITSIAPFTGAVGTLVTINGSNFFDTTLLKIGGVSALRISNTNTQIVAMVMPGATTGNITLTNGGNSVNAGSMFTVSSTLYPVSQQGNKLFGNDGSVDGSQGSGYSVAVSADGNTAIVGGSTDSLGLGAAWIYVRNGSSWSQQGKKLTPYNIGSYGYALTSPNFGTAVALSADGNVALIGGSNDSAGVGAAWVFTRLNNMWSIQGKLSGKNSVGFPSQGVSVALSGDGNTALVGGLGDNSSIGAVWAYGRNKNGIWSQNGNKLVGSGYSGLSQQGYSLGISSDGKTAIVGGSQDNNGQGAFWIYKNTTGSWVQQGNKVTDATILNANQGSAVALNADGTTAIVGVPFFNNGQGIATVYNYSGSSWVKQTNIQGLNINGLAQYGYSVSLSADGNTAVVGAPYDNNNIGACWTFTRKGGVWSQKGNKLIGLGISGTSYFGNASSVSSDGSTTIIGGNNDNNGKGATWSYISSPVPRIGSFDPDSAIDGQTVIIKGANLGSVSAVSFGKVNAKSFSKVVENGDTTIAAVVSSGASGFVKVTNPFGTDSAAGFVFLTCQPVYKTVALSICASAFPFTWNGITCNSVGSYKATLKSYTGCDSIVTLNLTSNANPIITVPTDTSGCASASLTAKGGKSYLWSGGLNPSSATNSFNASGVYTVTATDSNNCTSTAYVFVTIFPLPIATISGKFSGCDSVKLYANGGNKYQWSGGTTPTISSNTFKTSGTYSLIVTDTGTKCSTSISFKDTIYKQATITIGGASSGCDSAKIWTLGAPKKSTFSWNGGLNFVSDTNRIVSSGNYSVSVLDTNGCTTKASKTITINKSPDPSITGNDTACNVVTLTGNGGVSYTWSGGNNPTSKTNTFTNSGRYALTVKDANGCTNYDSVFVKINLPPSITMEQSSNGCGSVYITATPADTTAPLIYNWNGAGSYPTNRSNTFTNSGNYTLKVTDTVTGCFTTKSQSVAITNQHIVELINSGVNTCVGNALLTVSGGASAYKSVIFKDSAYYSNSVLKDTLVAQHIDSIPKGGSSISISSFKPKGEGRYFAFVYFNDGCNAMTPYDTVRIAKIGIVGLTTACKQVILTGTGGKTYNWNGGKSPKSAINTFDTIGTKTVMLSAIDSNGCLGTASTTIVVNNFPAPIGTITTNTGTDAGCDSIILTATVNSGKSPYAYLWLNGSKTPNSATNKSYKSGIDTVKITDGNGCSILVSKDIKINPHPTPFIKAYQNLCGKTIISAGGGGTYLWSGGLNKNSPIDTFIVAGTNIPITLKVTDSNSCSSILFDTITVKAIPVLKYVGNPISCDSVVLTVSGGAGYVWSGGKYTTRNRNVFDISGNYMVTGYNSNGCSDSLKISVSVDPQKPMLNVVANKSSICSGDTVLYTATPTYGGSAPKYSWYVGSILQSIPNASTFKYTPTNKDSIRCILTSDMLCLVSDTAISNKVTQIVTQRVLPVVTITASSNTICTGTKVTFKATTTNAGVAPVFQWKKNNVNVGLSDSTYYDSTLKDKDSVWCVLTSSLACTTASTVVSNKQVLSVTQYIVPAINIVASNTVICAGSSVTFTAKATNGGLTPIFSWRKNGLTIAGASGNTYTASNPVGKDSFSCVLASSLSCISSNSINSNGIVITINSNNIWTGAASKSWSVDSNWCSGVAPKMGTDVTIPVVAKNNYPILSTNITVGNIAIAKGATLSINGNTLLINGTVSDLGYLKGSATSNLIINSTVTPTIYFNPALNDSLLSSLTINGVGGAKLGTGIGITRLLQLNAGNLNLNGKYLTLKSTSITATAVVGPVGSGASITGNVTVERYIPKGFKAYRQLSTGGIYNAGSIFNNWQEGGRNPNGYGTYIIGSKDTIAGGVNPVTGLDKTSNGNFGLYLFPKSTATWTAVTNTKSKNLDPYVGYHLAIFGDRNGILYYRFFDSIRAMTSATTLRTTGQLITGTITYGTTGVTGLYNSTESALAANANSATFIANPYSSIVDWEALTSTGLTTSYSYFDPTYLTAAGYQVYVIYNGTSHVNNNPSVSKINRYIQPGQAFWVQNSNNNATRQLIFKESNKVVDTSKFTAVFGTNQTINRLAISLWKDVAGVGNANIDGAVAVFDNRFTKQYGDEDSRKMQNPKENLSIVETESDLAIDGLAIPKENEVIHLKLSQLSASTTYRLRVDADLFKAEGLQAYLQDAYLNKQTAIGSDATIYEFTSTGVATEMSNRFSIIFAKKATVTPIAEVSNEGKITLYPNPTNGKATSIKLTEMAKGSYTIAVYNTLGQQVMVKTIWHNGGTYSYPISLPMQKGMANVKVLDANGKQWLQTPLLVD